MSKYPIKYIKYYGFKLWAMQISILFLNKLQVFTNLKNKLIIAKNKKIYEKLIKDYDYLIKKYQSKKPVYQNNDVIYQYWLDGFENAPELAKICLKSVKENIKDYKIIELSEKNIYNYVEIPQAIKAKMEKGKISKTHYSDIIRANLLKNNGGIWFDATTYLPKKLNRDYLDNFITIKSDCKEDTSISKCIWTVGYLNGKNKTLFEFLNDFYIDYWKKYDLIIDYFLLDFVIKIAYENLDYVKDYFDKNKNNNKNLFLLNDFLNKVYDSEKFTKIMQAKENTIFKINFKKEFFLRKDGYMTNYAHLMDKDQKIPKKIHYVWVGGNPKPKDIKKCMKSWKKHLKDYEIMEWNETNFDINSHPFCKAAYEAKKWAYVSDYIRAYVIYHEGGVYLDTDNIVVDSIDDLLYNRAFVGYENDKYPFTACFGAEKHHPLLKKLLEYYDENDFRFDASDQMKEVNTKIVANILIDDFGCKTGNVEQLLKEDIKVYKKEVLCNPSKSSKVIHVFTGTWMEGIKPLKRKIVKFLKLRIKTPKSAGLYNKYIGKGKN